MSEHLADTARIDLPNSPAKFWCLDATTPRDIMTLNKLGANFKTLNPAYLPTWINTVASGDFDLDGWPDFVGSSSSYSNVLVFVRNMGVLGQIGTFEIVHWIDGCAGGSSGTPVLGVQGQGLDIEGHISLTSGDYDGDGDVDFFFVASQSASPYTAKRLWLYRNNLITNGAKGTSVSFDQVDMTSAWSGRLAGIGWSGTCLDSLNVDGDVDIDILFGNSAGQVFKLTNTNNGQVNSATFVVDPTALIATGWTLRGINALTAADYDKDGDVDIIVGSVATDSLRYYKDDGSGDYDLFASYTDKLKVLSNDEYDGAATVLLTGDFDQDGDPDFVVGTDNWNYPLNNGSATGYGGKVYMFRTDGPKTFTQKILFDGPSQGAPVGDMDCGMVFDYDKDGVIDFLIADGNHSQRYYLFVNQVAPVYTLNGQGVSLDMTPTLDPRLYAITRVRMTRLTQSVIGSSSTGLSAAYYVSNNDGRSWELYIQHAASSITSYTDLPWHDFSTFGTRLRWKAVFSAAVDAMTDYVNASFETPSLDEIALEFVYVDRREYSRTTDPIATLKIDGSNRKILYAATFYFPGYQGELRAYDLTDVVMTDTSNSVLKTVSAADTSSPTGRILSEGTTLLWDAGQLLNARTADSRTVYASVGGNNLSRIAFTRDNVGALSSILKDPDGDNTGLIDFIRGEGRDWKLGDIQHSNPVLLRPPSRDAILMGAGYTDYAAALADRRTVVFVGANDGMLHCFDASTGEELWGYVPQNLLSKLKNLSIRDRDTGFRALSHDSFVDGSAVVAEVQIGGAWRTVLVCGQGQGKSLSTKSGINYYFALDVTDPLNPQPLWELTATSMGETWSIPALGRVRINGADAWVAFMGSGYDNNPDADAGRAFYAVPLDTGAIVRSFEVENIDTSTLASRPYADIPVAIPGSPSTVDFNGDGYVDFVYVGDLDGRLWKIRTTEDTVHSWPLTAIYMDHKAYPIITRPAVWQESGLIAGAVHVLFGTGGDDRAPSDRTYAFLSVVDGDTPAVEWYLGDAAELNLESRLSTGTMETGEKAWADPVIADSIVYFNTLKGSIENVNPCLNLAEGGKLYARFIRAMGGGIMGATALKTESGAAESFALTSKARRMVTVGDRVGTGTTAKREVYIQEYNSSIERLEQQSGRVQLIIKSWREVYQIIR